MSQTTRFRPVLESLEDRVVPAGFRSLPGIDPGFRSGFSILQSLALPPQQQPPATGFVEGIRSGEGILGTGILSGGFPGTGIEGSLGGVGFPSPAAPNTVPAEAVIPETELPEDPVLEEDAFDESAPGEGIPGTGVAGTGRSGEGIEGTGIPVSGTPEESAELLTPPPFPAALERFFTSLAASGFSI